MSASPAVALSARASAGLPSCVWFQPFRLSSEALKLVLASKVVCVGLCPRASAGLLGCGFRPWGRCQPVWLWLWALGLVLVSQTGAGALGLSGCGCDFRPLGRFQPCWLGLQAPGLVLASQAGDESSGCSASAGLPACGFRPRGLFRHLGLWL